MKSVLLVEDEPAVANYLKMCLQHEGYIVHHFSTLADARAGLGTAFNLILLDLMLPDGTSDEFVPDLRRQFPKTPIFIVTGVAPDDERLVRCLQLGASGYVGKTARIEELLRHINRAFGN